MRRARPIAALIAVVSATALTAGCSTSPTDAATVNGTAISRTQLKQGVATVSQLFGAEQASRAQVTTLMIQGVLADQVAAQRNITINDGARYAALSTARLDENDPSTALSAIALRDPSTRPVLFDFADVTIVRRAAGDAPLVAAIRSADVRVNPRYGSWDTSKSLVVIAGNGSLSQVLQPADQ